jgi:hypothetical protein
MATPLTAPTVAPYLSADITLSAGSSIIFSVTGTHVGEPIEIRKKDSQNAYWVISELALPSQVNSSSFNNSQRVMTLSNPSATAITLQVYKPPSGIASGVDQD